MKKIFSKTQKGFTLIELLIVIAILGILATAVLSAINPVEQINRGRDTGSQSDAEQLLGAILRFNAAQGYFPWLTDGNDTTMTPFLNATGWTVISDNLAPGGIDFSADGWTEDNAGTIKVMAKLGSDEVAYSGASKELQTSFVTKIVNTSYNHLYVYNHGGTGESTYVCFVPKSGSFNTTAKNRCGVDGAGLPSDLSYEKAIICDDTNSIYYSCLP